MTAQPLHRATQSHRRIVDTLSAILSFARILVGCGSGYIADTVQEHTGAKIVGINISPEQIATARAHAESSGKLGELLDFQVGSMNDPLPFDDGSFDAVYIMQAWV